MTNEKELLAVKEKVFAELSKEPTKLIYYSDLLDYKLVDPSGGI